MHASFAASPARPAGQPGIQGGAPAGTWLAPGRWVPPLADGQETSQNTERGRFFWLLPAPGRHVLQLGAGGKQAKTLRGVDYFGPKAETLNPKT